MNNINSKMNTSEKLKSTKICSCRLLRYYNIKSIFLILICFISLFIYYQSTIKTSSGLKMHVSDFGKMFLISTPTCQIPDIDPYNKEVVDLVKRLEPIQCSKHEHLLTYIQIEDGVPTLHVRNEVVSTYSNIAITCCYSNVSRKTDDKISVSDCKPFENNVKITESIIKVTCSNWIKTVYENVHAVIQPIPAKAKSSANKSASNKYSVLFFGIDSMSNNNLIRTMPKTKNFLDNHKYLHLKGYNKVGDNTYPNLMPLLTGRNWTQLYDYCEPETHYANTCDIIWDKFRDLNYVTAYAEDESDVNTFNYGKKGFLEPPTDHYFRPYILAYEELPVKRVASSRHCTGPENTAERILNLAYEFVSTYKNRPKFGFFWTVSFSHNDVNLPSSMDIKIVNFLTKIHPKLSDTFFFFMSDHGIRFGPFRNTYTGSIEERLPYMYIHVPDSFKSKFSKEYKILLKNLYKLTSPYDIFMTLQDILYMADSTYQIQHSIGCPSCHSLFKEITLTRNCEDAGIPDQYCLCKTKLPLDVSSNLVKSAASFVVLEINNLVRRFKEGDQCANYFLKRISSAASSTRYDDKKNKFINEIVIKIETSPSATFEATVIARQDGSYKISGDFSRLDRYAFKSRCVADIFLKKYCYCDYLYIKILGSLF